jgi:hypothetical protein
MSLEQFLDRMIAPGNFLAISMKGDQGLFNRFFPRNNIPSAASFIHWGSDKKRWDTWFALASYTSATEKINDKTQRRSYQGERTQANAQSLKTFWFDADIKRAGDNKDPSKVFASVQEVAAWAKDFTQATGIPLPNVWVRSGYGVHLYWVLAEALDRAQWQPHAEAFKAALATHQAKGDISVVADSARILRPIETFNFKDQAHPAPCYLIVNGEDYPNDELLTPIGTRQVQKGATTGSAKPPKQMLAQSTSRMATSMAANARAGLSARPRDLTLIAQECAQVRQSMQEHGQHDGRQLWHALLNLIFFCEESEDWSHAIGDLHPKYDEADTDAEIARVKTEHDKKPFGPSLCSTFDAERTGICASCPHNGKVTTPYQLGLIAAPPGSLPYGYRRNNGWIEKGDGDQWHHIIEGDIDDPVLENFEGYRLRLTFWHRHPKGDRMIVVVHDELNWNSGHGIFSRAGIYTNMFNAKETVNLIMAWIDQLLGVTKLRHKPLPSFGWASDNGAYCGFSLAGTYYGADGSEIVAPGAGSAVINRYAPQGSLANWQKAATFVAADIPELHTAIAASFAGPLMTLGGGTGGCIAFVGPSGVGKTSAFVAGATVWGNPQDTMISLDDTSNYQSMFLGQIRSLPLYWDEAKIATKEKQLELVSMLHKLTQGRDKGRLTANVQIRPTSEWNTIFPLATNDSVIDMIAAQDRQKSATMLRCLEVNVPPRDIARTVNAEQVIANLQLNYGEAGRVYARYLATHIKSVKDIINKAKDVIIGRTQPFHVEERFYISMAAGIVAGSILARRLGIIDLDTKGILDVLCRAIVQAREIRLRYEPKNKLDTMIKVLDEFCADNMTARVITSYFARRGPNNRDFHAPQLPLSNPSLPTPAFQIACMDYAIRIDVVHFQAWCAKKGLPSSQLLRQMEEEWMAIRSRGALGAGTAYYSMARYYVQIPLVKPELQHILDEYPQFVTTGSAPPVHKLKLSPRSGAVSGLAPRPTIN